MGGPGGGDEYSFVALNKAEESIGGLFGSDIIKLINA